MFFVAPIQKSVKNHVFLGPKCRKPRVLRCFVGVRRLREPPPGEGKWGELGGAGGGFWGGKTVLLKTENIENILLKTMYDLPSKDIPFIYNYYSYLNAQQKLNYSLSPFHLNMNKLEKKENF